MNKPTTLIIGLTNKCTTHCTFCYSRDETITPAYFPLDRYKSLLSELQGIKTVEFSGIGEPTLHPQFHDYVSYTRSNYPDMNIQLVTNGSLLFPDMVQFLLKQKINQIWISTNALSNTVRKLVMPNTESSMVWQAVKMIKQGEYNSKVLMSFVVTKDNYQEVEEFINVALCYNVDSVLIRPVDSMLCESIYKEQSVTKEQFEKIYKRIKIKSLYQKRIMIAPNKAFWGDTNNKVHKCNIPDNIFGLYYSSGEVTFCCYMAADIKAHSLGNIYDSTAMEIWNGQKANEYRMLNNPICKKCSVWWL